jgi:hypothetical protein
MTSSRASFPSRTSRVCLLCTVFKTSSELIHPPVQLVSGIFLSGIRRLECEASSDVNARYCSATHELNTETTNGMWIWSLKAGNILLPAESSYFTEIACSDGKLVRTSMHSWGVRHTAGMDVPAVVFKPSGNHMYRGFGGLVVSMLASGTRVCGFKPGRSRRIFFGRKNPPSEGK